MSGRKHCSLSWENAWPWHSGWDAKDVSITSNSCGKLTCGFYIPYPTTQFCELGVFNTTPPKRGVDHRVSPMSSVLYLIRRTHIYACVYICVYAHSHLYVHVGMNKQTHPRWQKHTATCNMSHVPCRSIPAPRWASPTRKPRTPRNQSTSTNTTAVDGAAKTPWLLSQIFASPRHVGHLKGWELETTENSTQDVHISPSMRDIRVGFHGARICDWRSWSMNGGCKAIFCNFCGFSNPIFGVCENGSRSQQLLCLPRT